MGERLAGLDGLRALSIGLVLAMHLSLVGLLKHPLEPAYLGRQGVCLFFVLSGFLITRILLGKKYSLAQFYLRRALRIFPAYYFYLSIVGLLTVCGLYTIEPLSFFAAATYWINWYPWGREWPLQHTWSLAVEEQFYLSWPLALAASGERRSVPVLLGALSLWPLQRFLRTGHWGHSGGYEEALFAATYDSILWGCLAALVCQRGIRLPFPWLPSFLLGGLLLSPQMFPSVAIPGTRGLALGWWVAWVTQNGRHILVRGLEFGPLAWVGRRSYELYLWHLLFCDPRWAARLGWPLVLGLTLLVSELSYRLVELPLLHWRDRRWAPLGEE